MPDVPEPSTTATADAPTARLETGRSTPTAPRGGQKTEGVKVIFEQVVVALVLAFIFRGFVVEAFIIPTGSMATTLLGAHMRFDCPDCGWNFTVNYDTRGGLAAVPTEAYTLQNGRPVERTYTVRCPNCGYRLPELDLENPDSDGTGPAVYHGDRILVLKHLYLLKNPDRWDVVVFKNPSPTLPGTPERNPDSTEAHQENYIKRLVGLPGDTLVLVSGDVYVAGDVGNSPTSELTPEDFGIARKSDVAQQSLWRIVYDDSHRPRGVNRSYTDHRGAPVNDPAWAMPWAIDKGWTIVEPEQGGGFRVEDDADASLTFEADANSETFALTDYLGYDTTIGDQQYGPLGPNNSPLASTFGPRWDFPGSVGRQTGKFWLSWVSDLKLRTFYERGEGDGPLRLELGKRNIVFVAELTSDGAKLLRLPENGEPETLAEISRSGLFDTGRFVEFENVDYRVTLRVDGDVILQTTDAQYAPDLAALIDEEESNRVEPRPTVRITADGHAASLKHLSLWRDIYYTGRSHTGSFYPFASPASFPNNVIRLSDLSGEEEYFTLGDNPFLSGDARTWMSPVRLRYENLALDEGGRVPARFMLGKAFFVYWPGGYQPAGWLPRVVPNFGDMRFIR